MITKHHQSMYQTPHGANRFLSLMSKMMNLAERWEYRQLNSNPCRHIERYKEEGRQIYLSMEQIEKIGHIIKPMEQTESIFVLFAIKLLLFTGRRTGEILTLKWDYIDFENSKMNHLIQKQEQNHSSFQTVKQILLNLPNKEGFVFKSVLKDKRVSTCKTYLEKICKLAKIENVRRHMIYVILMQVWQFKMVIHFQLYLKC